MRSLKLAHRARTPRTTGVLILLLSLGVACESVSGGGAPEAANGTAAASADTSCRTITPDDALITVLSFRTAGGTCIPPGRLLAYRCGPHRDPVMVFGLRSAAPRTYLGGRYSVPVRHLPEGAQLVGISGQAKAFAVPDDPRWLYVQEDESLSKWLPLPLEEALPTAGAALPTAFLLGDSILAGSELTLLTMLPDWSLVFDAQVGRGSAGGILALGAQATVPHDAVVVELGTNDADPLAFETNLGTMLGLLGDSDLVVLVTVHSPKDVAADVNRAIHRAARTVPNAVIADWSEDAPPRALSADGVHLDPDRSGAFAKFLAPFLTSWYSTLRGNGARHCADSVEAPIGD